MPKIQIAKYECMGNDFMVVNPARPPMRWTGSRVKALCDRRRGVGADGLILLNPARGGKARFRLFNADGSKAEWSGNGVRCAAASVAAKRRLKTMTMVTAAGRIPVTCAVKGRVQFAVTIERPLPVVDRVSASAAVRAPKARGPFAVDAGNPHWVYLVREFDFPWETIGARCQHATPRTHGVNVEFVLVHGPGKIELRLFERGVGPTPSSGSGALAAVAVGWHQSLIRKRLRVVSPGGTQTIEITPDADSVRLTGTARFVFAGMWDTD